jgi:hypothetical protein
MRKLIFPMVPIVAVLAGPLPALAQNVRVQGFVSWSNSQSTLTTDQGGSIELGNSAQPGAVPYIDFHYGVGSAQDYNVRIQNSGDGHLNLQSPWLDVPQGRLMLGQNGAAGQIFTGDAANCGNGLPCKLVFSANADGWFHLIPFPGYFYNGVCIGCGGTVNLFVNGTAYKTGAAVWTSWSDARLKHDIRPLGGALSRLLALRPVSFAWNDPAKYGGGRTRQVGFVAQEVEKVLPEWIGTGPDGYKTIEMVGFESLTVKALQELAEQNRRLDEHNRRLEERIAALEAGGHPQRAPAERGALGLAALVGLVLIGIPWARRRHTSTSS